MKNKILILIIAVLLIITIYQSNIIFNLEEISYTENDMYRVRNIILENTEITDLDYQMYDLNNDGVLDIFDMMIIKRHILEIEKIPITKISKYTIEIKHTENDIMEIKKLCTEEDYYILQKIILNNIKPTDLDLIKYDFNYDGILNSSDYVTLANIIKEGDK